MWSIENKTLPTNHPFLDFRIFLTAVWEVFNLTQPTRIQLDLAYNLQHGTPDDFIGAFRGVGKSWITCAFVVWCLLLDPHLKIEVISASEKLAIDDATFIAQIINECSFTQHLKPKPGQRKAILSFDVGPTKSVKDPSINVLGITGQLTGTRADIVIADDIEVPRNSESQTQRDKIRQKVTEFDSIRKSGGRVIYLGTPQLADSLYFNLPDCFRIMLWPSEYPSLERIESEGERLAKFVTDAVLFGDAEPGTSTEPGRFPDGDLLDRRAKMGSSNYELQFLLNTAANDANRYPLKCSDLILLDLDPDEGPDKVYYGSHRDQEIEMPVVGLRGDRFYQAMKTSPGMSPWERVLLMIDPSGTGKDETSYCILKQLNSQIFMADWGGLQGGYSDEVLAALRDLARNHKITDCAIEKNFGDGMFAKLFQPWLNDLKDGACRIEDVRVTGQKEVRIIDTLEPVMNQHRLIVDKKLVEKDYNSILSYDTDDAYRYRGFYQMTHITRDKHSLGKDDRIDVLHLGVNYLLEGMDLNQQQHAEALQFERDMKRSKYWVDTAGRTHETIQQGQPNWMNY